MKLTESHIRSLIGKKEDERVEFKRASSELPDNLWETYSAFCNTDGGTIILGIREGKNKTYSIEGVSDAHKLIDDFWSAANNSEKVSYSIFFGHYVYPVKCGRKTVVVIEVPRAPREARPVYVGEDVFKGSFRRNGEGDYHCSREAVKAMLRDQCAETADMCVLDELLVSDLNAETIKRYRGRFSNFKVGHVWNDLPDDEFLTKIGAARQCPDGKVHPTLAGLVCFGDFVTIMRVLPDYFLDYRERLSNETRWNDRVAAHDATWSGNIYDFFFKIHDRVTGDVKVPYKIAADGITRIDDTPVHKALREVLANALIHADYHGRRGIVVEKHFRTITFSNPGTMRISKSVAVAGGTSDARNTAIFNIFALVDIGERSGMGLANLHGLWKKYGYAEPKITESYDPDRTVIVVTTDDDTENDTVTRPENGSEPDQNPTRIRPEVDNNLEGDNKVANNADGGSEVDNKVDNKVDNNADGGSEVDNKVDNNAEGDNKSEGGNKQDERRLLKELPASCRQVFQALLEDGFSTQQALISKLGLSRTAITNAIAILIKEHYIIRRGARKNGYWEVLP